MAGANRPRRPGQPARRPLPGKRPTSQAAPIEQPPAAPYYPQQYSQQPNGQYYPQQNPGLPPQYAQQPQYGQQPQYVQQPPQYVQQPPQYVQQPPQYVQPAPQQYVQPAPQQYVQPAPQQYQNGAHAPVRQPIRRPTSKQTTTRQPAQQQSGVRRPTGTPQQGVTRRPTGTPQQQTPAPNVQRTRRPTASATQSGMQAPAQRQTTQRRAGAGPRRPSTRRNPGIDPERPYGDESTWKAPQDALQARSIGICILLYIVTLSIYQWVWTYKIHKELPRRRGRDVSAGTALMLVMIPKLAGWTTLSLFVYDAFSQMKTNPGGEYDPSIMLIIVYILVTMGGVICQFYVYPRLSTRITMISLERFGKGHPKVNSGIASWWLACDLIVAQPIPLFKFIAFIASLVLQIVWWVIAQSTLNQIAEASQETAYTEAERAGDAEQYAEA